MLLKEKGKKDGQPIPMGWDEAQAAIAAGTHEVVDAEGKEIVEPEAPEPEPAPEEDKPAKPASSSKK